MQPDPVHKTLYVEGNISFFSKYKLLQNDQVDGGWKCELKA